VVGGLAGRGDRRNLGPEWSAIRSGQRVATPPNQLLWRARRSLRSPSGSGRELSRQELAEAVNAYLWQNYEERHNVDATYVGHLEQGRYRWPGRRRREAFRRVLGVDRDAEIGFYITRGGTATAGSAGCPACGSRTATSRAA
jgi:hypothetical protein